MKRRLGGNLVIAVEDDDKRRSETLVERLEVAAREYRKAGVILGRELGQAGRLALGELGGGGIEIVEERRDVAVALVELVPQGRELAVL